jgi:phosphatidylcholine synthase
MVVLVLFAVEPNYWLMLALVVGLSITMFIPLKFVHPVRTERWRSITLPMALAWTFFAGWAAWVDFHPESWAHWGLVVTSIYLISAGILQQIIPAKDA